MVTWNDVPISQTNGNLTNFVVLYADNNTLTYTETIIDANSYHAELKNLKIFNPYKIRVVARNRRGEGISSFPFVVWTEMEGTYCKLFSQVVDHGSISSDLNLPLFFTAPNAAPMIQSAHNQSSTSVYLEWTAVPEENHLGILLGYLVKYRLDQTGKNCQTLGTILEYTIRCDTKPEENRGNKILCIAT